MVIKKSTSTPVSVTASTTSSNTKELEAKIAELETKLETLISVLKVNPKNNIEKLSNGTL